MELINKYQNGPVTVEIYDDGTKIREWDDEKYGIEPELEFAESLDVKITNYCDMNCAFCFPDKSVKVSTPSGEKYIEELQVGDEVYSYNIKTGEIEIQHVTKTYKREYNGDVIVNNFENGNIASTPNHKIYTLTGYKEADQLGNNDIIITVN